VVVDVLGRTDPVLAVIGPGTVVSAKPTEPVFVLSPVPNVLSLLLSFSLFFEFAPSSRKPIGEGAGWRQLGNGASKLSGCGDGLRCAGFHSTGLLVAADRVGFGAVECYGFSTA